MNLKPVDFKAVAAKGCFVYVYLRHSDSKTGKVYSPYYVGIAVSNLSNQRHRRPFGKHCSAPVPADKRFIRVLKSGLTEEQACAWERFYIFWYGREHEGGLLLNRAEGGEVNSGWKQSEDLKKKMSFLMKGRDITWTQKISEALVGRECTWGFKISESRKRNGTSNTRTSENIAKQKATIALKTRDSFRTPEMIAKTKETKQRKSAQQLGVTFEQYAALTEKQARAIKARFKRGKRGAELTAGLITI